MADVFISYSKGQADNIAQQIADTLNRAGISCWYMGRDSRHGRYPGKITQAIRECSVFVLILNHKSNKSKDVLSEVNIAFKYEREIIPFHIDDCEMSDDLFYHLSPFTTINASPPDEQRVQELVEEIADILGREPPQPAPVPTLKPEPPPAKIIKSGKCGDNITYTLDEKGVLTISGYGSMWYFRGKFRSLSPPVIFSDVPWQNNRRLISHVEIQSGVTSIQSFAFAGCKRLTNIAIPDSITFIGIFAFNGCNNLTSVSVPIKAKVDELAFPDNVRIERRP